MGFQSSEMGANRVVKWGADGAVEWIVGRHSPDLGAAPGEARVLQRIIGVAHGCAVVGDMQCYYEIKNLVHVWDEDGLWVGRLLENPDLSAAPESAYRLCTENFGGALYEVGPDERVPGLRPGDVIFFGSGQNSTPVFRITGWDRFARRAGTITVTPETAARMAATVESERQRPGLVRIAYLPAGRAQVDGKLDEWRDVEPLLIDDGKRTVARVYLGWNPNGLYAAFDVSTDRPWRSASSVREAFTGGAAVDLSLGPIEPARREPGAGDVRYVAAPVEGATRLVEFMPVLAPGLPERDRRPARYETAAHGVVAFDRVAALAEECVAARVKGEDAEPSAAGLLQGEEATAETGYVVEVRVPLRAPLLLRPRERFRLDASVILADPLAGGSDARLTWHSRAGEDQLVSADIAIESRLRPANWGEAVLDR
jgi:hypothetical protein